MKKNIVTLVFLFLLGRLSAQNYDCYKVGDIIHSVLDTSLFQKLHGNKWKLLASQDVTNTDLVKKHDYYSFEERDDNGETYYIRTLPQAKGVFLMPSTKAGIFGFDKFQSHSHFIPLATDDNYSDPQSNTFARSNNVILNQVYPNSGLRTEKNNDGAIETRPRNIALYIYIKVDE